MTQLGYRLQYFVQTAWRGLRSSLLPSGVAVLTIAIALGLMGGFGLLVLNMQGLLERFGEDLQVSVYLAADVSKERTQEIDATLKSVESVQRVEYVSREEALKRFLAVAGENAAMLDGLDENPLPASFVLTLAPEKRTKQDMTIVVESLRGLPDIEDITYGADWVESYTRAIGFVRWLAAGLGGVLAFATVMIVANTIRLAVYARRDEIEILSLVGASRIFVSVPFLLEGMLQGLLGGLSAIGILYFAFRLVLPEIQSGLQLLVGLATPHFFGPSEMLLLVACGVGLGWFGSLLALIGGYRH